MLRATYELAPPEAAETLALIESVGRAEGPEHVRAHVVAYERGRAVIEFPQTNWGRDVTLLVSSLLAGEWADAAAFTRCRLVGVEWPRGLLPGPAFEAPGCVLVGAIVKPSLGLTPAEVAATATQLAEGGADLVKDDELLGDPEWCRLEDRISEVAGVLPSRVRYAANVSGAADSLLARAARAVELGAGALMLNAFAQGLDALRALRDADFGVPLFAHRVGAALWARDKNFGVSPVVIAELTRLCGADYVQVGSFTGSVYDTGDEVRAQITACREGADDVNPAVAVIGGGVGPENAEAQLEAAGTTSGTMLLLGSAAYANGSPEAAVRAVRAVADSYS